MSARLASGWHWLRGVPGTVSRGQLLLAAKTGVGAGLAWWAALSLGHTDGRPYFAPLAVVLVVQATVYDSLSRAVQRVVGVMIGVAVALAVSRVVPLNGWAVAGVVFVGLVVGRVLRLGPSGMVQVPVSALLVLFVGSVSKGYPGQRIIDTIVGAAIGVAVVLVSPSAPRIDQIATMADEPLERAAELLAAIGTGVGGAWTQEQAAEWHAAAVAGVTSVLAARSALENEELAARWNARARNLPPQLERSAAALTVARRVAIHVRSMTMALTSVPAGEPPKPVLGEVLTSLADLVRAYAGWVVHEDNDVARGAFHDAIAAAEARVETFLELAEERWRSDAQRWLTLGVVLSGAQRILAVITEPVDV